MSIANCHRCKRVFRQANSALLCPDCKQQESSQLQHLISFLEESSAVSMETVAKQCGISVKDLESLIFKGKLGPAADCIICKCQRCSAAVTGTKRRGRFCVECAEKIESQPGFHGAPKALPPTDSKPAAVPIQKPAPPPRPQNEPATPPAEKIEPAPLFTENYGFTRASER